MAIVLGTCLHVSSLSLAGLNTSSSAAFGIANVLLLWVIAAQLAPALRMKATRFGTICLHGNKYAIVISTLIFMPSIILSNFADITRASRSNQVDTLDLIARLDLAFSVAYFASYFLSALALTLSLEQALRVRADSMLGITKV